MPFVRSARCEGFAWGAQDIDADDIADFYTCGFVSDRGCTLGSVPECNFYTMDVPPNNCTTRATFDCSLCADCDVGFSLDESYNCVETCPEGTYAGAW